MRQDTSDETIKCRSDQELARDCRLIIAEMYRRNYRPILSDYEKFGRKEMLFQKTTTV